MSRLRLEDLNRDLRSDKNLKDFWKQATLNFLVLHHSLNRKLTMKKVGS